MVRQVGLIVALGLDTREKVELKKRELAKRKVDSDNVITV